MSVMVEFGGKKSDRHRKKRFYNAIRQQIEFYLGDVNLSKDRFFSRLLEQSPYIDVDIILKCNKIRKLTTDPKDIVKSLKKSSLLSVTEDETKIFRTAPVTPISNADDCTIYVEDLPLEVDHDWLRNAFSVYGDVVYVSVPHYKGSNKIKGFAFVQFDTPENANKALEAFGSVNSCLFSGMAPTKLRSVQTFEGEKDVVVREHGQIQPENLKCIEMNPPINSETDDVEPPPKKRKKCDTKSTKIEEKSKSVNNDVEAVEKENVEKNETKSKCKKEKSNSEEKVQIASESEKTDGENSEDKREKKRKRKKHKKTEQVQTYGMQILSKQDWKRLRNKYLEEQRRKMHELKHQLRKASIKQNEKLKLDQESDEPVDKMEAAESPSSECRVKFVPGVIVKVNLDTPIRDVKHFKNDVKRYADVEYIDISENNTVAYFRCRSNEIASQIIALNKWPNMTILQGAEELSYWDKIKQDRKEKFEKKIRCNTRGKNKLIKKVETALSTHIKFPE